MLKLIRRYRLPRPPASGSQRRPCEAERRSNLCHDTFNITLADPKVNPR
jgi:hypothetical protein